MSFDPVAYREQVERELTEFLDRMFYRRLLPLAGLTMLVIAVLVDTILGGQ